MAEWLKAADGKSVRVAYVGSNPTPTPIFLLILRFLSTIFVFFEILRSYVSKKVIGYLEEEYMIRSNEIRSSVAEIRSSLAAYGEEIRSSLAAYGEEICTETSEMYEKIDKKLRHFFLLIFLLLFAAFVPIYALLVLSFLP